MKSKEEKLWLESMEEIGLTANRQIMLSSYYSFIMDNNLKHLGFVLSRYKFAAKMIENKKHINLLELGCNHGLGMQFFAQMRACDKMVGVDFDGEAVRWANDTWSGGNVTFVEDDFLGKDYRSFGGGSEYDAVISIDVIEHIPHEKEDLFLRTIDLNLSRDGLAIIGTPNITMTPYASRGSQLAHVNVFDQKRLYGLLSRLFQNVFIFGMTDEVLHTGFYPMCCYIMALCANKK